jgi:hypothetical protein
MLQMQRTAGNQAVARALTSAAPRRMIQRGRVLRNGQVQTVPDDQELPTDRRVILFSECDVRLQNPHDTARGGDPNNPNASKVSETQFAATTEGVDATIGDYGNASGGNLKLWNTGASSLWYGGIRKDPVVRITPQENLNHPDTILTIILPGAAVRRVSPSPDGPAKTPFGFVGVHGLSGTITPEDRIWTTAAWVHLSLAVPTVTGLNAAGYMEFELLSGVKIIIDLKR